MLSINKPFSNIPFNSKNKYRPIFFDGYIYLLGAYNFINVINKEVKNLIVEQEKNGFGMLVVAENDKNIVNCKIVSSFNVMEL